MTTRFAFTTRLGAAVAAAATVAASLVAAVVLAPAAHADPAPVAERTSGMVTTDALPTVQIDGVVWSQVIVGNTVYVGGSFANARPAGSAAGTNLIPRANILAYNLTTGVLITSFAPVMNAQVLVLTASPDGTRLYAGGDFTTVNGIPRPRLAAFDTTTGALITSFAAKVDFRAKALAATNSTLYVGGGFSTANDVARGKLASFNASDGSLTSWNPDADDMVNAIVLTPDGSRIIAGGAFQHVGGLNAYGLAAISTATGALLPWAAGNTIKTAGPNSAVTSLTTDGVSVYGSSYTFTGGGGNFEGTFAADPNSGTLKWMEDCHGDTYGNFSNGSAVYIVSHSHYCANVGGFPETDVRTWHHSLAFSLDATGTLLKERQGYANFQGQPSPTMYNWFPDMTTGTYTGQTQAAWTVTGNSQYIIEGGEFPTVNGVGQQGLVRFAVPGVAPSKDGPRVGGANFLPTLTSLTTNSVRVSWLSNWDRDDTTLTYKVIRDSNPTPIYTTTENSTFWARPGMGFTDTDVTPGSTHKYRIVATDPSGNANSGNYVSITLPAAGTLTSYGRKLIADGASTYWPLDEPSGLAIDNAGYNDAIVSAAGVTRGVAGAIANDAAETFNGSTGQVYTQSTVNAPTTFTLSTWIKTTTTTGGKIIGFGSAQTGLSKSYDRQIYMTNAGKLTFGVYNNAYQTISSPLSYNDGQWHQVVASFGATGMALYVDGQRVGTNASNASTTLITGYWRVGGDNLTGWPSKPTSSYFNGSIDEVAIFPTVLPRRTVLDEYVASGRTSPNSSAPADLYGSTVYGDDPDLYWRLNETGGTVANDTGAYVSPGDYVGANTFGTAGALSGNPDTAVTFNGTNGFAVSRTAIANPSVYSEEAWFKTNTTRGGKIIGFGSTRTATSGSYDRHVYMQNDGRLVFGAYNGAQVTITSTNSYNNNAWHQVVATQGADGMKLYVDGALIGSNTNTVAQNYTGYWRVGGGATWGSTSAYFAGAIDEAAVYSKVLTPQQVSLHYTTGSTGLPPNVLPTASITASTSDLTAELDGSASNDPDGSIASYAWNFGDGSTATGVTASHTYLAGGTYTVTLTVTDNRGATGVSTKSVTVVPNVAPTAAFTSSASFLNTSFDAATSNDPDGSIASYAWNFGDGSTATGVTASHTYLAAGTYTVTLTVTDNLGATGVSTQSLTVSSQPPNQLPTATITSTVTGLSVAFDGRGSSDPDGTIASYAWDFGDGTTATGSTATHVYAAVATYVATLTVTDDRGGTSVGTQSVTTAPAVFAQDDFTRTSTSGWGTADIGGAWTVTGGATNLTVNGTTAKMKLAALGASPTAFLNTVSARDQVTTVDVSLDSVPTGGGTYVSVAGRRIGTSDYRLKARFQPAATSLQLTKVVSGTETVLKTFTIAGYVYTAGDTLRLKLELSGSGTTTLSGKMWNVNTTEPAAYQISTTDTQATLQSAGGSGLIGYLSGSATLAPVTVSFDKLTVSALN